MIRKILFAICLVFTIAWFAAGYIVKNNIVALLKNTESDNIKITYDNIKVAGYPTQSRVIIINPKIKFIDLANSNEISCKQIVVTTDLSFKKAEIDLGHELVKEEISSDRTTQYIIKSNYGIKGLIKFNKPLYRINNQDSTHSITKFLQFDNKLISVNTKEKELFNVQDLAFLVNRLHSLQRDNIGLNLHLLYEGQGTFLPFHKAEIDLATKISFLNLLSDKIIAIDRFVFTCDDDSQIDLIGTLQLSKNALPQGKLSFALANYHNIIDKLLPENNLVSKSMIKHIIQQSVSSLSTAESKENNDATTYKNVKFDIEFSDRGINIGSINLLEFKLKNGEVESEGQ